MVNRPSSRPSLRVPSRGMSDVLIESGRWGRAGGTFSSFTGTTGPVGVKTDVDGRREPGV